MKTAYEAMTEILDINETIEALKNKNTGNSPDLVLCKTVDILVDYRKILVEVLKHTDVQFGADRNNPYID